MFSHKKDDEWNEKIFYYKYNKIIQEQKYILKCFEQARFRYFLWKNCLLELNLLIKKFTATTEARIYISFKKEKNE